MATKGRDLTRLKLARRGHAPGTPTPSPPGQPPARVSGALAGSVTASPATGGGGIWRAYQGPHGIVYAAIQNFGGVAGRGHHSVLPPRPYMTTGADVPEISRAGEEAFHRVMGGG
jgi:phage gpG-like protein